MSTFFPVLMVKMEYLLIWLLDLQTYHPITMGGNLLREW